ncbi:MAG: tRNA dihydrouridine(20/20a) synthase DusA, partial [Hyphomonadaceae bacterium]
ENFLPYIAARLDDGVPLHAMTRHMLGHFHGAPGGRLWRRALSEGAHAPGAGVETVRAALDAMRRARGGALAA